jgi:DNA-binding transcriptional MocR family regulator
MKRYEQYADEIAELIRTQALRAGDRLPSVRQASAGRRISPSTVFQAYYLLEARGLVKSRPRSGYYVTARPPRLRAEPAVSAPLERSVDVEISDLVFQVVGSTRNRDVVPLGSAFPSPTLFPLDKLARHLASSMKRLDPWRTVEDLTPGNLSLRRQLSLRYVIDGTHVDTDEIVVTNGAMEALNLSLQVTTQPGDVVAVEAPTFYACLQALERLKLKAVEVATHPRLGVDLESLRAVLDRHPVKACWFMTNFQNPLGSLMAVAAKQAMVDLLAERGIPLIEDDVYGELYFSNQRPPPAKSFDKRGLVLHCSSFSKCLAPGYRVGWVAAGRFAERIERLKLMTTLAVAVPTQEAISEYLQQGGYDRHLRQLRLSLAAQQSVALRTIAKCFPKGTRVTRPEGGYFLWLEMPLSVDALHLHRLALSHNISIAPGHLFSADRRFTSCVRLNCGHPGDSRFDAALKTLGQLASSLIGATTARAAAATR